MNVLRRLWAALRGTDRTPHLGALLACLKVYGVTRFEGMGVRIEMGPPAPEAPAAAAPLVEDPALAALRRLQALMPGSR